MAVVSFLMGHFDFCVASVAGLLALHEVMQEAAARMSEANSIFIVFHIFGYLRQKYIIFWYFPKFQHHMTLLPLNRSLDEQLGEPQEEIDEGESADY